MNNETNLIDWGLAKQVMAGEAEGGDGYVVKPRPDGVLVAVIDGVGHGPKASKVARTTEQILTQYGHEPLSSLFNRSHEALRGTRGVVMSLAIIKPANGQMVWFGVGNVEGMLLKADKFAANNRTRNLNAYILTQAAQQGNRENILLKGGILGYQMPSLRPTTTSIAEGDLLILVTDGIRSSYSQAIPYQDSPQQIADYIMETYSRGTDDALVLVAKYKGAEAS